MTTRNNSTQTNIEIPKKLNKNEVRFSKIKRRFLKHVWVARFLVLLLVLTGLSLTILFSVSLLSKTTLPQIVNLAKAFINPKSVAIKATQGRTNILLMGKGGAGHEAPDLTDSMMLISISDGESDMAIISLPRDIWVKDLRTKLNSVYYWGNQKQAGGGLVLAESVVEEILGVPVHYGVVADFSAFGKILDIVGKIEVYVENSFTDSKFPIAGKEEDLCDGDKSLSCRYETISFEKGFQQMDSVIALKFVRSRNADGAEGTDFARNVRQQRVVNALLAKLKSKEIVFSPGKLFQVLNVILDSFETDIPSNQGAVISRYVFDARNSVNNLYLPEELLVNPSKSFEYDNLYVLVSYSGDWETIRSWIKQKLY